MKEACRFFSFLFPIRQHEALQKISRERGIPLAVLIRQGIDLLLEKSKTCQRCSDDK